MFILHSSNKTENLLEHISIILNQSPLASPFTKEVFLIQSQGMERWLSQQLATQFGVFANFDFLFPGKFFSEMAWKTQQKLSTDVFARELMVWRFELLLRDLKEPVFAPLYQYLVGENSDLKRFQLATHLAQIFDQYQIMRPYLLNDWQQGKLNYKHPSEKWQQALWKKLTEQTGEQHRGALWLQAIKHFNQAEEESLSQQLPERISVFGLNTMPPLFMQFLQGLARHTNVHFHLLNPAQAFWADMVSKKQADLEGFDNGHPLLASLGQQGREFQQMLLDCPFEMALDSFAENESDNTLSLLQQVQNDLLNNESFSDSQVEKDSSISIHSCHSRLREVEVLKAQLIHALESDKTLELRDIVVMAPNIEHYAPFISAVFEDIQHGIADKSLRSSNATLEAYLRFLRLTQGRFGWQSVMDLLDQKEVYRCFGLNETEVTLIRHWVAETRIRWAKSAAHKKSLGLPESQENTWESGLERLLMGYAVGSDEGFFADVLPYRDIEGTSAQAVGGLVTFIQLLFNASKRLSQTYSLQDWASHLLNYTDLLFPSANMTQEQQAEKLQINEIFLELQHEVGQIHQEEVALSVVLAWLDGRVTETKSSNGFLRGQLTFCSMLPMRSIPFQVIAILGMNEGEFPHIDHSPTFDLLAQNFQAGDRSRRADDRYQFLEILLSTRQQLIMTYIGQSISANETLPASVIVQELLDVLQGHYHLSDMVTEHPLHNFSPRYFQESSDLISYNPDDLATANRLSQAHKPAELWWQGSLSTEEPTIIDINDLLRFYRHPQRYFFTQQLKIRLNSLSDEEPEHEIFSLNTLENHSLDSEFLEQMLQNKTPDLATLKAQGRWVSGELGKVLFEKKTQEIHAFAQTILAKGLGTIKDPIIIDIELAGVHLQGTLANQYTKDNLLYRHASLKGKDFISAWIHHLIMNRVKKTDTHLIAKDKSGVFQASTDSKDALEQLIHLYQRGREHPETFFTEAALSYLKQSSAKNAKISPLDKAKDALTQDITQSYESELNLLYGELENMHGLLDDEFETVCNELLLPAWQAF